MPTFRKQYNPISHPIVIKCQAAEEVRLGELMKFQGDLKTLSKENRERLARGMLLNGFSAPVFVWDRNDEKIIMDGHQRVEVLEWLQTQGWEIPEIPVAYIEAADEQDARVKLLSITSQYGEFDKDVLMTWVDEIESDVADFIRVVNKEIKLIVDDDNVSDIEMPEMMQLVITIDDEEQLRALYEEMTERGYECRLSTL